MLVGLAILVSLYWLSRIPHFLPRNLRRLPTEDLPTPEASVSLVIAARDEAEHIEQSVRSFAAQDYPDFEIIVVNDRSQDRTGLILEELARVEPRLKVVTVSELPEGWLGKCWALHQGTRQAKGKWLLFSDGDVMLEPDTLKKAVSLCESEKLDHLCLAPRIISSSPLQDAVIQSLALLFFLFQDPRRLRDRDRPRAYMGLGAFNLIRKETYDAFGGHEPLRLEIVDDVFLGMLVKRQGGRSALYLGPQAAQIRWYAGLGAYIRGLEKNAFAGLRFSWFLLAVAIVGQTLIFFAPIGWMILGDPILFFLGCLSLTISHALYLTTCVRQGSPASRSLLLLPAILLQFYTFTRSAITITRRKSVVWRDTSYGLDELKAAQRRLRGPWI